MNNAEGLLCETCMVALRSNNSDNRNRFSIAHHQDYRSFVASISNNCFICTWLWAKHIPPSMMLESGTGDAASKRFRILCKLKYRGYGHLKDSFDVIFLVSSSWAPDFELPLCFLRKRELVGKLGPSTCRDALPSLPWSELKARPWSKLDSQIGSSQDLRIIKTWISRCESKHGDCCKASTFFPSRVIDVQDAELGIVRLRNREYVKATQESASTTYPPYWTLSHRWGDPKNILQLTKNTEKDFHRSIPVNNLSPTFRDAALVVRRLGFRYIWIDSLCIFQDSLADWHREANDVVNIYRSSFCNISAIGASHSSLEEGLFRERRLARRLLYPFVVKANLRSANETSWMVWNDSVWDDEVEGAPLSTRGWVVQERFLATRVVHFTENQIFWECLHSIHCSVDPDSCLMTIGTKARSCTTTTSYKSSRLELERCSPIPQHIFDREWRFILSAYLRCNLTKQSDRLIAISGITKAFQEARGDKYIAGIWKSTIHTDLAWESRASLGVPAERSNYYAPNWSWASIVEIQVLSPYTPKYKSIPKSLIRLVAERMIPDPLDGDSSGPLRSAELYIKCTMHYYRWTRQSKLVIYNNEKRLDCHQEFSEMGSHSQDLRLDTSALVNQFNNVNEVEGICIPLYEGKKRSYELPCVPYVPHVRT
ncbi:heterokaryon incompatibility protein-domain-containing protein [Nemania sp. FL0031]|nr:heterokaryon incompatibility protein-domain-containing protein [Nemania sp. FL0031]